MDSIQTVKPNILNYLALSEKKKMHILKNFLKDFSKSQVWESLMTISSLHLEKHQARGRENEVTCSVLQS